MRGDYWSFVVTQNSDLRKKDNQNSLVINRRTYYFLLSDYKTKVAHGPILIKIPNDIAPLLTKLRKRLKVDPMTGQTFLFQKYNGRPYKGAGAFLKSMKIFFKEYLNKNVGISLLRKIWVTDYLQEKRSLADRKRIARMMGNSVETQMLYYDKIE